jgi:hypothetical protein
MQLRLCGEVSSFLMRRRIFLCRLCRAVKLQIHDSPEALARLDVGLPRPETAKWPLSFINLSDLLTLCVCA